MHYIFYVITHISHMYSKLSHLSSVHIVVVVVFSVCFSVSTWTRTCFFCSIRTFLLFMFEKLVCFVSISWSPLCKPSPIRAHFFLYLAIQLTHVFCTFAVSLERHCRLRGNLLFYFKSGDQFSEPQGVIVLEKCEPVIRNEKREHDGFVFFIGMFYWPISIKFHPL